MPTRVYVVARVPATAREACEQLVNPYLASPNDPGVYTFSVPLVPLDGPDNAEPTAYGVCSSTMDDSGLFKALVPLQAAITGSAYAVASPFRTFSADLHWTGWLGAGGLKERREVV